MPNQESYVPNPDLIFRLKRKGLIGRQISQRLLMDSGVHVRVI